ncbi:MAG: butyrate kinase [Solobacterium sp.]|nr:butyrate kinase [Solobacterium sp.]
MEKYRIFVINPGSTSTKLAMFENEEKTFECDVFHDSTILKTFPTLNDQVNYRMEVIFDFLKENGISLEGIDAIAARGGGCYSVISGTYEITDLLVADAKANKGKLYHASLLGVQLAQRVHEIYGGKMYMIDPTCTDELQDLARITGVKGCYRHAASHPLNLKAVSRKYAESIGKKYSEINVIACHIDGGTSVTAHRKGMMIDALDGAGGEGPFTPTRMGGMAVTDVLRFLYGKPADEIRDLCSVTGGFSSWFGTSNSDTVHALVENNDPKAVMIWNAMIYRIAKSIGEMAMVLHGDVDAILLTGGLMRFDDIREKLEEYCGWVAPIAVFPGEYEMEALSKGVLRVLRGEEEARTYSGKPVWDGFDWDQD